MSEKTLLDSQELVETLGTPVPGLLLLRYRSALVLDALLKELPATLGKRPLHEVRYDPRDAHHDQGSPSALTAHCRALVDDTVPVIFLRPEPGEIVEADFAPVVTFWKQLNAHREPLGDLPAQLVLCLDLAQTPFAFAHAKDLISWCSPKFELLALTPAADGEKTSLRNETARTNSGASSLLTWNTLQIFWQEILASGNPPIAADSEKILIPLLRSALDLGMVEQGTRLVAQAADTSFPDESTRALWLLLCGELAVARGDLVGALGFFTDSHSIRETLATNDPTNTEWQRELSVSLEKLGNLALDQGDVAGALHSFTQSYRIAKRLATSDPTNAEWQRDLSVSLNRLGDIAVAQGNLADASRYFTDDMAIAERLAAGDPTDAGWQRDLCVSLNKMGNVTAAQGDLAGALQYITQAKVIAERLAASDPANAEWQRDLSVSLERLGDLALTQGDFAGALRSFTEHKVISERLATSDPTNTAWQRDLSVALEKLGELAVAQGDLAGALRYFTDDIAIAERLAASDPTNAGWQRDLAVSHLKFFQFAKAKGDEAMVESELRACYTVLHGMRQRGFHMDAQITKMFEQLAARFGAV